MHFNVATRGILTQFGRVLGLHSPTALVSVCIEIL